MAFTVTGEIILSTSTYKPYICGTYQEASGCLKEHGSVVLSFDIDMVKLFEYFVFSLGIESLPLFINSKIYHFKERFRLYDRSTEWVQLIRDKLT